MVRKNALKDRRHALKMRMVCFFFIHMECVDVGEEDFGQLMSADLYCGV